MTKPFYSGNMFTSLLAVLFIGLKLTGHIDWSWWWVLAPLWMPFAVAMVVMGVCGALMAVLKK